MVEKHYRADEAAGLLGVSEDTLLSLARQKRIAHARPYGSRVVLFPESALERWLAGLPPAGEDDASVIPMRRRG